MLQPVPFTTELVPTVVPAKFEVAQGKLVAFKHKLFEGTATATAQIVPVKAVVAATVLLILI